MIGRFEKVGGSMNARARGTAMVESVLIFPLLVVLYGAIMMTGKTYSSAMKAQQHARRDSMWWCIVPEGSSAVQSTVEPVAYPGERDAMLPLVKNNLADSAKYNPDTIFGGDVGKPMTDSQAENAATALLARRIYSELNATLNLDSSFAPFTHYQDQRLIKVDWHGGTLNFMGEVKGASFYECYGGKFGGARQAEGEDNVPALVQDTATDRSAILSGYVAQVKCTGKGITTACGNGAAPPASSAKPPEFDVHPPSDP